MDGVIRWVLHAQFGQAAGITLRWSEARGGEEEDKRENNWDGLLK